jgi:predicted HTH domain antitoxin
LNAQDLWLGKKGGEKMASLTVTLELPRDLLGALEVPQVQMEARLRELIALELFREGRISSGKGAEILGISKLAFIQLLSQHGIDYFTESSEELKSEVAMLDQLLGGDGV